MNISKKQLYLLITYALLLLSTVIASRFLDQKNVELVKKYDLLHVLLQGLLTVANWDFVFIFGKIVFYSFPSFLVGGLASVIKKNNFDLTIVICQVQALCLIIILWIVYRNWGINYEQLMQIM
tara:strand:+ start:177 stop:545 length:369 start_codon:yes stop_codon:yes gene_type:complete